MDKSYSICTSDKSFKTNIRKVAYCNMLMDFSQLVLNTAQDGEVRDLAKNALGYSGSLLNHAIHDFITQNVMFDEEYCKSSQGNL